MLRFGLFLCAAGVVGSAQPKTIVFSRAGVSQIGLFVSKADGTDERPLLKSGSLDYNPVWSPDGQWIVFTSERRGSADLYRVRLDGTGLERLTDSPAFDDQAAFSPDGRQIVFVSTRADGTADLWVLDLRTRKVRSLTSGPGGDFRPLGPLMGSGLPSPPTVEARSNGTAGGNGGCTFTSWIFT